MTESSSFIDMLVTGIGQRLREVDEEITNIDLRAKMVLADILQKAEEEQADLLVERERLEAMLQALKTTEPKATTNSKPRKPLTAEHKAKISAAAAKKRAAKATTSSKGTRRKRSEQTT